MTIKSEGIDRYKVLVVGKNGKLNETIEGSALWSKVRGGLSCQGITSLLYIACLMLICIAPIYILATR